MARRLLQLPHHSLQGEHEDVDLQGDDVELKLWFFTVEVVDNRLQNSVRWFHWFKVTEDSWDIRKQKERSNEYLPLGYLSASKLLDQSFSQVQKDLLWLLSFSWFLFRHIYEYLSFELQHMDHSHRKEVRVLFADPCELVLIDFLDNFNLRIYLFESLILLLWLSHWQSVEKVSDWNPDFRCERFHCVKFASQFIRLHILSRFQLWEVRCDLVKFMPFFKLILWL